MYQQAMVVMPLTYEPKITDGFCKRQRDGKTSLYTLLRNASTHAYGIVTTIVLLGIGLRHHGVSME